jgi:hypothetical protein
MTAVYIILGVLYALYEIWNHYVAVMHLKHARDEKKLTKEQMPLAYMSMLIGYLIDAFVNIVICTILFLELPKEVLVTQRVIRHKFKGKGWRQKLATWICDKLLDTLDPSGCHCKE